MAFCAPLLRASTQAPNYNHAVRIILPPPPPLDKEFQLTQIALGLPSLKRDSDKSYKQSLEKLLLPLQNYHFRIILKAESYRLEEIQDIIANYRELAGEIHTYVKQSQSRTDGINKSISEGESITISDRTEEAKDAEEAYTRLALTRSAIMTVGVAASFAASTCATPIAAQAIATGARAIDSTLKEKQKEAKRKMHQTKSEGYNKNTTEGTSTSIGLNIENINKHAEFCEKMIEQYIERFQHGLSHGMWNVSAYIQADDESTLSAVRHTLKSVYSGEDSYYEAMRFSPIQDNTNIQAEKLPTLKASITNPIHHTFGQFSTAMNTQELSIISALPHNDIHGISVSRLSSFGLTQSHSTQNHSRGERIELGTILSRKTPTPQRFYLSPEAINSHIFVCGVTGSGKSNTIKHILTQLQSNPTLDKHIPFLVIEPAKSEYKHLIEGATLKAQGEEIKIKNLQIFRPGVRDDALKLNPFVFDFSRNNHAITLTKHVDMLKTTFSSAFPMYGPMPYILEDALHRIYEDRGWDFDTEDNYSFVEANSADYDANSLLFPTMEDLRDKIDEVVEEAGYAKELDSNFKAALKTRIKNLTLGVKGKIFNSRHAIDSKTLFENPTIIELSHISDDAEKSFLMGLILNKLYHYRESQGDSSGELKHVCIIEEAHRLLPNIPLDRGEEANAKGKAVETFVNMLAEIRSYGQGLIIADQIASKLHPDIVKNTNIKILQRTMDKEDRELIGNAINLDENQIRDIAELQTGEAIVHHKDIHQAFMVQIDEIKTSTASEERFSEFTKNFLDKNERYKYSLIGEKNYHIPHFDYSKIKAIDIDDLKHSFLQLLNAILLDQDYQSKKEAFFSLYKTTNPDEYFYLFAHAWKSLSYLSNIRYYKNISQYTDTYLDVKNLIINLHKPSETDNLKNTIKDFKQRFNLTNIKRFFPILKDYDANILHWILLGVENIKSRGIASELKAIMASKLKLPDTNTKQETKLIFQACTKELEQASAFICAYYANLFPNDREA